jgi:CRP-like cAMP-binding protein
VDKRLPGECFGEVALLRNQPRIATVQARSPSRVVVLERQAFLLAMGSHERSMRAADELADERTAWAAKQLARQTVARADPPSGGRQPSACRCYELR